MVMPRLPWPVLGAAHGAEIELGPRKCARAGGPEEGAPRDPPKNAKMSARGGCHHTSVGQKRSAAQESGLAAARAKKSKKNEEIES